MPNKEFGLLDLLLIAAENLRLLIAGPLLAGLIVLAYAYTIEPTYSASTVLILPTQHQGSALAMVPSMGTQGNFLGVAGTFSLGDLYCIILKSSTLRDALIDRFNLLERLDSKSRESARKYLEGSVLINNRKDGLITIETSDKDPEFAAQIANAHVDELKKQLAKMVVEEAQRRRFFFEKQLAVAKDKLLSTEQALAYSGINSNVLNLSDAAFNSVAQLIDQITAQEIKIASMRGHLVETAPELMQASLDLTILRNKLNNFKKKDTSSGLTGEGTDYTTKLREYKYAETELTFFLKQFDAARLDETWEGSGIQVLDPAERPLYKIKPKKRLMAVMATLFTAFFIIIFIFIRQGNRNALPD